MTTSSLRTAALLSAAALACGSGSSAPPAPLPAGSLDPTFGQGGVVRPSGARAAAVALDAQQRIVAVGKVGTSCIGVWRYLPDGHPDATFGEGGVALSGLDAPSCAATDWYPSADAVAVDAAGRIVVAGAVDPMAGVRPVLWRLGADGALDTTFGDQGLVDLAALLQQHGRASAIALDGQGRIVVAGMLATSVSNRPVYAAAVWRFGTDGALDATFAGAGWTSHLGGAPAYGPARADAVAIDDAGRVVAAGCSGTPAGATAPTVWRFGADGALDASLGGAGFVVLPAGAGAGDACATGLAASAGDVAAGGYVAGPRDADAAIWMLRDDGTLDASFGGAGWVSHDGAAGGPGDDLAAAIVRDPQGALVLAGTSADAAGHSRLAVWRYRSDGQLDPTFHDTGFVTYPSPIGGDASGAALVLDAQRRVVVGGWLQPAQDATAAAIWRIAPPSPAAD